MEAIAAILDEDRLPDASDLADKTMNKIGAVNAPIPGPNRSYPVEPPRINGDPAET